MPDKDNILKFKDNKGKDYLGNLKEIFHGLSMVIKMKETWYSTVLLNYGKQIFFDGAYMSGALKKMSRMYQVISDAYPSLANRISSQCTSIHSGAYYIIGTRGYMDVYLRIAVYLESIL